MPSTIQPPPIEEEVIWTQLVLFDQARTVHAHTASYRTEVFELSTSALLRRGLTLPAALVVWTVIACLSTAPACYNAAFVHLVILHCLITTLCTSIAAELVSHSQDSRTQRSKKHAGA